MPAPDFAAGMGAFLPDAALADAGTTTQTSLGLAQQDATGAAGAASSSPASAARVAQPGRAKGNELRQRVEHVAAFYAVRAAGRAGREMERKHPAAAKELVAQAHSGAPRLLNTTHFDPATGALSWPELLQQAEFEEQRITVGEIVGKWVKYGRLDYSDQRVLRENIVAMYDGMKSQIREIPPHDYIECRAFLQSVLYTTTKSMI